MDDTLTIATHLMVTAKISPKDRSIRSSWRKDMTFPISITLDSSRRSIQSR